MRVSVLRWYNVDIANELTCFRFCGQDEEHDPGEEFEEILACSVCGDNGELIPCCHILPWFSIWKAFKCENYRTRKRRRFSSKQCLERRSSM